MNAVESMDVMKGYEIKSGILSFHRGSWFTKDPKRTFHVHICVDVGPYLKVYDEKKNEIAQSLSWDQQKVSSYRVAVLGYNLTQAQYFFKALSDIKNLKNVEQAVLPTVEENDITLVLHRNYPKIGFVGKKNIQPKISLKAIEKFAQNLGLTNIELTNKDENKGCHVCLYLGEVSSEEGWSPTGEDKKVLGYIVTSGPLFYQLCSEEYRKIWLPAFEKSSFICKT